jgi:hypothetical protein
VKSGREGRDFGLAVGAEEVGNRCKKLYEVYVSIDRSRRDQSEVEMVQDGDDK